MEYSPGAVKIRIQDDGTGFDPAGANGLNAGHFGVTVMEERARRFGGSFRLESKPGQGTVVEAAMPLAPDHNHV
jgi:signal transduction histidine kinase